MNRNYRNINEIEQVEIQRFSTLVPELDWLYGFSTNDTTGQIVWGPPLGKLTLCVGAKGIGKTRVWVEICKGLANANQTVAFVQGELPPEQFVSEKLKDFESNDFYIIDDKEQTGIINAMLAIKPKILIVDSVNMLTNWRNGMGAGDIVDGTDALIGFREAAESVGCHVVFLAHMTMDGKTKGGSKMPHLVDVEMFIHAWDNSDTFKDALSSLFTVRTEKNRFNRGNLESWWCHHDWGVECQSKHRLKDDRWIEMPPSNLRRVMRKQHTPTPKAKSSVMQRMLSWL